MSASVQTDPSKAAGGEKAAVVTTVLLATDSPALSRNQKAKQRRAKRIARVATGQSPPVTKGVDRGHVRRLKRSLSRNQKRARKAHRDGIKEAKLVKEDPLFASTHRLASRTRLRDAGKLFDRCLQAIRDINCHGRREVKFSDKIAVFNACIIRREKNLCDYIK
jgi:hypothetical protein